MLILCFSVTLESRCGNSIASVLRFWIDVWPKTRKLAFYQHLPADHRLYGITEVDVAVFNLSLLQGWAKLN